MQQIGLFIGHFPLLENNSLLRCFELFRLFFLTHVYARWRFLPFAGSKCEQVVTEASYVVCGVTTCRPRQALLGVILCFVNSLFLWPWSHRLQSIQLLKQRHQGVERQSFRGLILNSLMEEAANILFLWKVITTSYWTRTLKQTKRQGLFTVTTQGNSGFICPNNCDTVKK